MMNIEIKNCNNIDSGKIQINENKLNIKYAMNGVGKSTIAKAVFESLPEKNISIIEQDSYYRDQTDLSMEERIKTNYDHPLAFDTDLLSS